MIQRTTVRLPDELLDRARRKAAAEGRTLTALIEEGLRTVVAKKKAVGSREVQLPISSVQGGPLPGIDLTNNAAIQEMEDLEYVERLNRGFK